MKVNTKPYGEMEVGDVQMLADSLITLGNDPSLRKTMGRAGRERFLREFTAEIMASRFEKLYYELLRNRSRSRIPSWGRDTKA